MITLRLLEVISAATLLLDCGLRLVERVKRYRDIFFPNRTPPRRDVEPQSTPKSAIVHRSLRDRPTAPCQIRGFLQREHYPRNHQGEVPKTVRWSFGQETGEGDRYLHKNSADHTKGSCDVGD